MSQLNDELDAVFTKHRRELHSTADKAQYVRNALRDLRLAIVPSMDRPERDNNELHTAVWEALNNAFSLVCADIERLPAVRAWTIAALVHGEMFEDTVYAETIEQAADRAAKRYPLADTLSVVKVPAE